jgi:putative membrane protein
MVLKAWLRVGVCLGLAVLLVQLIVSGELSLFVNPRFTWLIVASVLILVLLGLVQLWNMKGSELHRISAWGYVMLLLPLAMYLLIPPKALDASIASKKGVSYISAKSVNEQQQKKSAPAATSDTNADPLAVPEDPYKKFIPQLQPSITGNVCRLLQYAKLLSSTIQREEDQAQRVCLPR